MPLAFPQSVMLASEGQLFLLGLLSACARPRGRRSGFGAGDAVNVPGGLTFAPLLLRYAQRGAVELKFDDMSIGSWHIVGQPKASREGLDITLRGSSIFGADIERTQRWEWDFTDIRDCCLGEWTRIGGEEATIEARMDPECLLPEFDVSGTEALLRWKAPPRIRFTGGRWRRMKNLWLALRGDAVEWVRIGEAEGGVCVAGTVTRLIWE